jgi:hypothetical protein
MQRPISSMQLQARKIQRSPRWESYFVIRSLHVANFSRHNCPERL